MRVPARDIDGWDLAGIHLSPEARVREQESHDVIAAMNRAEWRWRRARRLVIQQALLSLVLGVACAALLLWLGGWF